MSYISTEHHTLPDEVLHPPKCPKLPNQSTTNRQRSGADEIITSTIWPFPTSMGVLHISHGKQILWRLAPLSLCGSMFVCQTVSCKRECRQLRKMPRLIWEEPKNVQCQQRPDFLHPSIPPLLLTLTLTLKQMIRKMNEQWVTIIDD